jgi:tetratricopeptide (TPR) repeat protein
MSDPTANGPSDQGAHDALEAGSGGGVLVSGRRVGDVGGFADLALPVGFCLACGVAQDPSPNCSSCGRSRAVAPVEHLTAGAVRVGYLGRGPGAPPGVAVDHVPGGAQPTAITVAGHVRKQSAREFGRLSTVDGLRPLQSRAAAVLLVLLQPPDRRFKGSPDALDAAADLMLGTTREHDEAHPNETPLAIARRAAAGLAIVGVTEPLPLLGLTPHELAWWTALAHINGGELRGAVTTLGQLPPDRYPAAVGLLLWCSRRVGADLAARVRMLVAERLEAGKGMRQVGAAIDAAGLDGPIYDWLWSPAALDAMPVDDVPFASSALDALHALAGHGGSGSTVSLPAGASDALIDDLIERGALPDAESIAALTAGSRRYILARTDPAALSDDDVSALRFVDERLRRAVLRREPFTPGNRHDPALAALVSLASGGGFDEQLPTYRSAATRGREADLVALGQFLQRGDLDMLTVDLTDDTSLWPLLADRLGTTQLLDGLRGDRVDVRFLGWAALTRAKQRLFEADWAQAFDLARESLRANPEPAAAAEAYNVMACACWQTRRNEHAQEALDQALGAAPNSSLQINLSIVTSELDPRRASADLARLVSSAPSLELRSAAALRAVSVWAPESLPWHDEPSPLPDNLSIALRNLVNEPIEIDLFRSIVKLLSVTDPAWLARSGSLTGSPHGRSLDARLYRGAAVGPLEYVSVLAEASRRSDTPEWVAVEIADTLRILRRRYRRNPAPSVHPDDSALALAMLERNLEPPQSDVLVPLAVCGVCDRVEPEGSAPDDWCAVNLADSEQYAHRAGRLADLRGLYQVAWNRLGEALAVYHRRRLLGAAEGFGRARHRLGKLPADRRAQVATAVLEPVLQRTDDAAEAIAQLLARITDDGVRDFMIQVGRSAAALAADADALIEPPDQTPVMPAPRRREGDQGTGGQSRPGIRLLGLGGDSAPYSVADGGGVLPGDPLLGGRGGVGDADEPVEDAWIDDDAEWDDDGDDEGDDDGDAENGRWGEDRGGDR